ncbi:MAG: methyltransferase domain-containing protein [Kovacikia sp.]
MNLDKLTTGDGITSKPSEWKFNADVAKSFDAHVSKSVPYYAETHQLAIEVSDWFVHDGCTVYDIGCSTGTLIGDLARRHVSKKITYIGLDSSKPMLEQARKNLDGYARIELLEADALDYHFGTDLAMVYSLYTMQFIDPQRRLEFCQKVYNSLSRRGAFVLVEKVLDIDPVLTDIFTHLHWAKKEEMGFDVTEIYAKAQALRGVLVPFTSEENFQMLVESGFSRVSTFFKWCNFCGIIAVK